MYLASNTQMLGEDEVGYLDLAKDFMKTNYPKSSYVIPPLTSLTYTVFFYIFGSSLSLAKAVITIFGFLTIIMVYLFCKKLDKTTFFGINVFGLASISILLTIMYFTHFMLISYTEIPIAFFSVSFIYFLLDFKSVKNAVILGLVMGLSIYAKSSALIFPLILFLFFLVKYIYKKDRYSFKLAIISCFIALLIILPFILRNLILFKYPYLEGFNIFFKPPTTGTSWGTGAVTKALSIPIDYFGLFGYIAVFSSIFGIVYSIQIKNEKMLLVIFMFLLFLLTYYVRSFLSMGIGDPRYFSIIFPEIAIIGGYYLGKVATCKKYLSIIIVIFFIFAFYTSVTVALSTSQSQRYPNDYIEAIKWIKQNTPEDALIFTAYGGSLKYYGDRTAFWASFNEFPEVMTSTNSTRIYNILKSYNISYILVWRGILAQNYIVPESNLIGAFTYNFLNQVYNDKEHFNMTYSNTNSQGQPDNFVFKLK
jgi:4-amino-4-deoxy-L-arabinose transferase-like glycosyltransferase